MFIHVLYIRFYFITVFIIISFFYVSGLTCIDVEIKWAAERDNEVSSKLSKLTFLI